MTKILSCLAIGLSVIPIVAEPPPAQVEIVDVPIGGIREKGSWTYYGGRIYFQSIRIARNGRELWAATSKGLVNFQIGEQRLTRFSTFDGLADNFTTEIAFGPRDDIWAATFSGLSRLTGKGWRSWFIADGLPSSRVHHVVVDSKGEPWVTTGDGFPAAISHLHNGTWVHYSKLYDGLDGLGIDLLHADHLGIVWAAVYDAEVSAFKRAGRRFSNSIIKFVRDGSWSRIPLPKHLLGLKNRRAISSFLTTREGRLLVASPIGLFIWDGTNWNRIGARDGLPHERVLDICDGPGGQIWGLTPRGVFVLIGQKAQTKYVAPRSLQPLFNKAEKLAVGPEGDVWLSIGPPVCALLHGRLDGKWKIYAPVQDGPITHPGKGVRSILKDTAGNYYFGALGRDGGITRFNGKRWDIVLHRNDVFDVDIDSRGQLWAATGRLLRLSGKEWVDETKRMGMAGSVYFVEKDSSGKLWIGGSKELIEWDGARTVPHHSDDVRLSPPYRACAIGPEGQIWITAGQSVAQWLGQRKWRVFDKHTGLPGSRTVDIELGRKGRIYVGGPWGAGSFDGLSWIHLVREGVNYLNALPVLPGSRVQDILVDRTGKVWYATEDGGVGQFNGKSWSSVTTRDGLPNNSVWSVFEDEDSIWFGTIGGVARMKIH